MSSNRKGLLKTIFTPNLGCGCGEPKPSDAIDPTPIPPRIDSSSSSLSLHEKLKPVKIKSCPCPSSSSSASHTTTTFSLPNSDASPSHRPDSEAPRSRIRSSIAVAKDSDDPYRDFRDSMLQMIREQEIYSRDALQELLHCFLKLNSPRYHAAIIRAFTAIWNGVTPGGGGDLDVRPSSGCQGNSDHDSDGVKGGSRE